MATGVPLVTTRVGQAADLVRHGENGWMVEVEDVDGLAPWVVHVADARRPSSTACWRAGRATAEESSYDALRPALARAPGRLRRAARAAGVSTWT